VHGVVANSGNANACTGQQGKQDAQAMGKAAAEACQTPDDSFFVCSTGRIGELLTLPPMLEVIKQCGAVARQGASDGMDFARCILTSDTKPKVCKASFSLGGQTVAIGGCAKGAGMIQPSMATMLAFITTDLAIDSPLLQKALQQAVSRSFNAITVDGDMSTNDTVLLMANGASGVTLAEDDELGLQAFQEALFLVCDCLADKIVADGERISKVVDLHIEGAASEADAERVARAIGNSLLVKTSWYGSDPNWGRLMDALGYADARIDPDVIDIHYEDTPALLEGTPLPQNKPKWKEIVSKRRFGIRIHLRQGQARYRLRTTDLTEGYVNFNKSE